MTAIVGNAFRKYNADSFINSFEDNNVYLMIGKKDEWASTGPGQYAGSGFSDTSIPTPIDTTQASYIHHNDMIAAKLIGTSDVSHVLKRVDWTSGTVYEEYDHLTDDIIDQDFFVFTSAYRVYKCISNYNGAASTVEPTGTSTAIIETLPDNYRWKFMYQVPVADILKFVTTDWIPMKYLSTDDGSTQWDVQQAAVDGALEHIDVTAGGTSYIENAGIAQSGSSTTITLESGASAVDYTYNTMSVWITSGTGANQLRTITDYDGTTKVATVATWTTNPDTTSVYEVMPSVSITTLEGSSATARVSKIEAGVIKQVSMVTVGTGYRSGTAVVTGGAGSGCTLEPRFGPPGGHGKNVVSELGGAFVMMNSRLIGADGSGDFPVGDDFRKVILIANPTVNNGTLASASTYHGPQGGIAPFGEGEGELDEDSGEIIYVEYRAPINRVADQTEDIKIVAEF